MQSGPRVDGADEDLNLQAVSEMATRAILHAQTNDARYRALVEHLPDTAVCVFDRDHRIIVAEGTGLDTWGLRGSALVGRTVDDVLSPDDATLLRVKLDGAFRGKASQAEMRSSPTGTEHLVDVVPLPPLRGNEVVEVLLVSRDITALKQRERDLAYTEKLWRTMFESAPIAIAQLEIDGTVRRANPAMHELTGYDHDELCGRNLATVLHVEDQQEARQALEGTLTGSRTLPFLDRRLIRHNGQMRWVNVRASLVHDDRNRPDYILMQMTDTTYEHRQTDRLAAAQARTAALVEYGTDVITVLDRDLTISYASPACHIVFGVQPDKVTGSPLITRIHPDDAAHVIATLQTLLTRPGAVTTFEARGIHLDGRWRTLEVTASNRLDDPAVEGVVCNCRDVTERAQATARLAHQAMHDILTGLPNRALLRDRLERALTHAAASPPSRCAVLFLDLDQFKQINDTLGHAAGDQFLVTIAERLRTEIRPGDSVARFGGDEFVVLAENIQSSRTALDIAGRIQIALKSPVPLTGQPVSVSCSIGVALSAHHTADVLLNEADTAMYWSKQQGGDQTQLYRPAMGTLASRR